MTLEEAITTSERLAKTSRYPYTPIIMTVTCGEEVLILRESMSKSSQYIHKDDYSRQSRLLRNWMAAHKGGK